MYLLNLSPLYTPQVLTLSAEWRVPQACGTQTGVPPFEPFPTIFNYTHMGARLFILIAEYSSKGQLQNGHSTYYTNYYNNKKNKSKSFFLVKNENMRSDFYAISLKQFPTQHSSMLVFSCAPGERDL